jgi:hypothetical protein
VGCTSANKSLVSKSYNLNNAQDITTLSITKELFPLINDNERVSYDLVAKNTTPVGNKLELIQNVRFDYDDKVEITTNITEYFGFTEEVVYLYSSPVTLSDMKDCAKKANKNSHSTIKIKNTEVGINYEIKACKKNEFVKIDSILSYHHSIKISKN